LTLLLLLLEALACFLTLLLLPQMEGALGR
jgi:hypothetical protein